MASTRRLFLVIGVLGLAGIALFVVLLLRSSIGDIMSAIRAAGWAILLVIGFHIVPLLTNTLAWWVIFPPDRRLPFKSLVWIRWLGESVSTLIPATAVGGEFVRARLAAKRGAAVSESAATVMGDVTLGIGSQIIFTLAGLFMLARLTGRGEFVRQGFAGALVGIAAIGGFFAVQRFGIYRIAHALMSRLVKSDRAGSLEEHGEALDRDLRDVYQRRRAVIASFFWSFVTWIVGAGEIWLSLWALGIPAGFEHAFVLESVCQGVRAVMFLIPGAMGVQEGGFVVVGGMLGIPAETSMALALIRRAREVAFGVPGLLAWQFLEGKWLLGGTEAPETSTQARPSVLRS